MNEGEALFVYSGSIRGRFTITPKGYGRLFRKG